MFGTTFAECGLVVETEERTMRQHYSVRRLSWREWQEIEEVLLDEIDLQVWYAVAYCTLLGGESFISLQ